jgi:hypothetical protein
LETTMHPNGKPQMVDVNNAPKWQTLNGRCKQCNQMSNFKWQM